MAVLIFSPEKVVVRSLQVFCRNIGYTDIFAFSELDKAAQFILEERKLKLILSAWMPSWDDLVYAMHRAQAAWPEHRFVPLVQILPHRPVLRLFNTKDIPKDEANRIDKYIVRPFSQRDLWEGIQDAHERRSRRRDTVLAIGKALAEPLLQILWSDEKLETRRHWKNALPVSTEREIKNCFEQNGSKIGVILADPSALTRNVVEVLAGFKKQPYAHGTPLVMVSKNPVHLAAARDFTDFSVEPGKRSIQAALDWAARRLESNWIVLRLLQASIDHMKIAQANPSIGHRKALHLLQAALKFDPDRWETHEAMGRYFMKVGEKELAIRHLLETLKRHPCSTRANICLLELTPAGSPEFADRSAAALSFCPPIPQLQALVRSKGKAA